MTTTKMALWMLGLLTAMSGCAAEGEAEDVGSHDDALRSLASTEVVGTLRDATAGRAKAPERGEAPYRAFKFTAVENTEYVANVVTSDGSDPIAYVLDANFRLVKRNDDRASGSKDAEVRFTSKKEGTFYLAFRTKEQTPATVMARVQESNPNTAFTGGFRDGWAIRPTRQGQKEQLAFNANVVGPGVTVANSVPFEGTASVDVRVDFAGNRVTVGRSLAATLVDLGADGSFEAFGIRGRVAAGGFVVVSKARATSCDHNVGGASACSGAEVHDAIGSSER